MSYTLPENEKNLLSLWLNWLVGSGSMTLLIVVSLWVSPLTLPLIAFGMQFMLFMRIRHDRVHNVPRCNLIIFTVSRVLFWSGVTMVFLNWLYSKEIIYKLFEASEINPEIPYITSLIVYPIGALVSGWVYLRRQKISFCADCHMRFGTPVERGVFGNTLSYESNYQILFLFILCIARALIVWTYYALRYVNASLNEPDRFFFFWAPTLIWLAAAVYIGLRYIGLWGYYIKRSDSSPTKSSQLRYMLFWDNYVCLRTPHLESDTIATAADLKFDTPLHTTLFQRTKVTLEEANRQFFNLTGMKDVDIRFMYANNSAIAQNYIYHYLCFFNDTEKAEFDKRYPDCEWFTLHNIADFINSGILESMFCSEFIRLHTIAMAWKTYTPTGHRKYKIKHYRPTFHLRDVHKWDIDYNDPLWLAIADNNADRPLFHFRRLWRKFINRIGLTGPADTSVSSK